MSNKEMKTKMNKEKTKITNPAMDKSKLFKILIEAKNERYKKACYYKISK
jgi:hypothetical protein